MRAHGLSSLLALVVAGGCAVVVGAGCGGGGEPHESDASPGDTAMDRPIDASGTGGAAGGPGGIGGSGGAGGGGGGGGSVVTGAEIGATCALAADCKSGFCFDGVCCRSDCSGMCQSCNQPGSVGTCTNVPVGADPRNDCPDDGATGCMRDGFCDGT
ncbi:MAG TPA: hypothetical protein VKQ32_09235, partial [Polyangia bacterium]|nr:hypothetical protein [Polyangia bacterium]